MRSLFGKVWPSTLKGQMILTFVVLMSVADALTFSALRVSQVWTFHNRQADLATRQFAAQVRYLKNTPNGELPGQVPPLLSSSDVVWIDSSNIVDRAEFDRDQWLEDDLERALRNRGVENVTAIYASYQRDPDRRPFALANDPFPLPKLLSDQGRKRAIPSEAFFALQAPWIDGWLTGRLRSSPPPPPLSLDAILMSIAPRPL